MVPWPAITRADVGLVEVLAVEHHLGAVPARRGDLGERRPFRHHDDRRDAEAGGVEGDGEAVVARAGRDHAPAALGRRELEQQVRRATLLERAGHLQILQLDEDARPGELGERLRVGAGGLGDRAGDALRGLPDVGDVDHQKGSSGSA
jgi:hypothetical protein